MNLGWLHSGWFWLAGLVAVPILVHLFAKARPPRLAFPDTRFILKVVEQTMRIKRPQDLLLLLLRTLLVAALIAAVLQPLLRDPESLDEGSGARTVVLVVDRSASMGWAEGGRTRVAGACSEAARLLEGLGASDRANVVWLDGNPSAVYATPGHNHGYLRTVLGAARGTAEVGFPEAALALATDQLADTDGRRQLVILSDFQRTQWEDVELNVPRGVKLVLLPIGEADADNGALVALACDPVQPLQGETVRLTADVANFAPVARTRTVTFDVGGRRLSSSVMLEPWGRGSAVVTVPLATPGEHVLSAWLDEDGLGVDDWRAHLIHVRGALHVAVSGEGAGEGTAATWRRAADALGWSEAVRVGETSELPDMLFMAAWRGPYDATLAEAREQGLPVVCLPAAGLPASTLGALLGVAPPLDAGPVAWETLDEAMAMQVAAPEDALFQVFGQGQFGDPASCSVMRRAQLPAWAVAHGEVLIRFADGGPALVRCPGRILLWAVPLDAVSSDWSGRVSFLPLFGELLLTERRRGAVAQEETEPGRALAWRAPLGADQIGLVDRDGEPITVAQNGVSEAGRLFISTPVALPGVYRWLTGTTVAQSTVVNASVRESDLRAMTPDAADGIDAVTVKSRSHGLETERPLWPLFAWLALAFVLLEAGVSVWADGMRSVGLLRARLQGVREKRRAVSLADEEAGE